MNTHFIDPITIKRIEELHPLIREEVRFLIYQLWKATIKVRITSAYRSEAEQNAIYAQGRTTPGKIVTKARGRFSTHQYRLAFDFALLSEDGKKVIWDTKFDGTDLNTTPDWVDVVTLFKNNGYDCGHYWKNFPDSPHIEGNTNIFVYNQPYDLLDFLLTPLEARVVVTNPTVMGGTGTARVELTKPIANIGIYNSMQVVADVQFTGGQMSSVQNFAVSQPLVAGQYFVRVRYREQHWIIPFRITNPATCDLTATFRALRPSLPRRTDGKILITPFTQNTTFPITVKYRPAGATDWIVGGMEIANLAPGAYQLELFQEGIGCTFTRTITVEDAKPKYLNSYNDLYGEPSRVEIYEINYQGETQDCETTPEGATISWINEGGEGEIASRTMGSRCDVSLLNELGNPYQWIEFSGGTTTKKYFLQIVKSNKLFWCGWPERKFYTQPISSDVNFTTISFFDGFALLKDLKLVALGDPTVKTLSAFDIIFRALTELDFRIPVYISHNLRSKTQLLGSEIESLRMLLFDRQQSADVKLNDLLGRALTECVLYLYEGAWHIKRWDEIGTKRQRRRYSWQGNFVSAENNYIEAYQTEDKENGPVEVDGRGELIIEDAYNKVVLKQDLKNFKEAIRLINNDDVRLINHSVSLELCQPASPAETPG